MRYIVTMMDWYRDENAPEEIQWLQKLVQRETDYFKPGTPFSEMKIDGKIVLVNSTDILRVKIEKK